MESDSQVPVLVFSVADLRCALPAGHVLSDVYRRGRNLLREWRLLPNPAQELRVRAAERMRDEVMGPI